jgi:hypothetical protein
VEPLLPVGEGARMNFWFTRDELGARWDAWQHTVQSYGNFALLVRYRDLRERGDYLSDFTIAQRRNEVNAWEVRQIRLLTGGAAR